MRTASAIRSTGRAAACTVSVVVLATMLTGIAVVDPGPGFLLGGIQVHEADHDAWFRALRSEGLDTVATTVYARQGDWDGDRLEWEEDEPWVVAEIRGAKRAGLRVVLIPRVALDHAFPRNRFLWHGMIQPRDRATRDRWFERYRAFVLEWAEIARREGVDLFAVGSELSALTSTAPTGAVPDLEAWYLDADAQRSRRDELLALGPELGTDHLVTRGRDRFGSLEAYLDAEIAAHRGWAEQVAFGGGPDAPGRIDARARDLDRRWRELIDAVRDVYPGPLTYAANFDQYRRVGFWDALDVVGINAYWSLRDGAEHVDAGRGLDAALDERWSAVLAEIDAHRVRIGRPRMPVVFTELGYTGRRGSTLRPWAGDGFWLRRSPDGRTVPYVGRDAPPDLSERARALEALGRALAVRDGPPLLRGILWWKLSTDPAHRAIEPFVAVLGTAEDRRLFEALRGIARLPAGPPATPPGPAGAPGDSGVSLGGSDTGHP